MQPARNDQLLRSGRTGRIAALPRRHGLLLAIVALALALRMAAFDTFAMLHPDELYQYLERAHRLAFGYGIVTWEQRYDMRSWLIPQLLSLPMRTGAFLSADAAAPVAVARASVTAISLALVFAAYAIGSVQSRTAGLLAAFAAAIWPQIVSMASHVLSENLCASAVLAGCALALQHDERGHARYAAGFLFGLSIILRMQSAAFIGVFVLALAWRDWRAWLQLAAGGIAALACGALSDIVAGQAPFAWAWNNYYENAIVDRSALYGVSSPLFYLERAVTDSNGMMLVAFVLALFSGPKFRPLLFACIAEYAAHSLIGHKEARFVFLSNATLVVLGAIGAARLFENGPLARLPKPVLPVAVLAVALAACGPGELDKLRGHTGVSRLAYRAAQDPAVCGLAISGHAFWRVAYAFVGRPLPIYTSSRFPIDVKARPRDVRAAANAYIATEKEPLLADWRRTACMQGHDGRYCLYRRQGGCDAKAGKEFELQRVLTEADL